MYPRVLSSRASQIPSSSPSSGTLDESFELVPQDDSCSSVQSSLSSSVSATKSVVSPGTNSSGIPSPSVSIDAAESLGNASGPAAQTSLGLTGTIEPSQIPSPSLSALDGLVPFSTSSELDMPSPSISSSRASQIPSPSKSLGDDVSSNGSVEHPVSAESEYPSLSSSISSTKVPP